MKQIQAIFRISKKKESEISRMAKISNISSMTKIIIQVIICLWSLRKMPRRVCLNNQNKFQFLPNLSERSFTY